MRGFFLLTLQLIETAEGAEKYLKHCVVQGVYNPETGAYSKFLLYLQNKQILSVVYGRINHGRSLDV